MEFYPSDSLIVVMMIPTQSKDRRRIARRIFKQMGKSWSINTGPIDGCNSKMNSCAKRFSGVWRKTGDEIIIRRGYLHDDFLAEWQWMRDHGYYCYDFDPYKDQVNYKEFRPEIQMLQVPGNGKIEFQFLISGEGTVTLDYESRKAGKLQKTVELQPLP